MSTDAFARLAELLAPIEPAAFFDRHWERAPAHLVAEARRARPLLDHGALVDAIHRLEAPPDGLMAFPEHLGRGALGEADLLRDHALLDAYLAEGHPIVWSRARGVFPEVDATCAALSEALGAHVWPNVYATGTAGTPFEMHFDCHEVFAVHCAGQKAWTISEVRVDRPLDARAMEATVRAVMRARRVEAEARPLLRVTVSPGDVVYIPRGQFHNASTPSGRSLHVTFGVRLVSGHDVAALLADLALAEPALREYLPPVAADRDGARAASRIEAIRATLAALIAGGELDRAITELTTHTADRSRPSRSG